VCLWIKPLLKSWEGEGDVLRSFFLLTRGDKRIKNTFKFLRDFYVGISWQVCWKVFILFRLRKAVVDRLHEETLEDLL